MADRGNGKGIGYFGRGYYRYSKGKVSQRSRLNAQLTEEIKAIFNKSRKTYGRPRIQAELTWQGHRCSRPRVARLMRQAGIAAKMKKRFKVTTRVNPVAKAAPNLLAQEMQEALAVYEQTQQKG